MELEGFCAIFGGKAVEEEPYMAPLGGYESRVGMAAYDREIEKGLYIIKPNASSCGKGIKVLGS